MGIPSSWDGFSAAGTVGQGNDAKRDRSILGPSRRYSLYSPLFKVLAACVTTSAQVFLRWHLQSQSSEQSTSAFDLVFGIYPVCEPSSLTAPTSLPLRFRRHYSCDAFTITNLCLIFLYWALVVDLFWRGWWGKKYLPWVFALGMTGSLVSLIVVRDLTTLFLQVLPAYWDVCMIGCLFHDAFSVLSRYEWGRREDWDGRYNES